MTSVTVEAQDIEKDFVIDRSLCKQLLVPFAAKRKICALKGVSFRLKSGEILGVVGPNEAGKTTLLRILAHLLDPDGGWVKLCGQRLVNGDCNLRGNIGYVSSDERSFFWRLTGKQNLEFFSRLYGVHKSDGHRRIRKLLKVFALEEKANQLFRDYSTGTRKKFALIRALTHQPKIVLLDEVTNSLDSASTQSVKSLVRKYVSSRDGCAGVWSTHRLEEIVEICDKLLVLNKGRVSFFGPVSDLQSRCNQKGDHFKDGQFEGRSGSSCKYSFLLRAVELSINSI
ncbi:MAG: ABC transporter ATP-binding protein [Desulfobacteraceae bacterium]|nr:ABC transporter ATP-binding protein [Desulfobacteraceae bacterium]